MTKTVDINFNFIDILACFFYNSSRNDVSNSIKALSVIATILFLFQEIFSVYLCILVGKFFPFILFPVVC